MINLIKEHSELWQRIQDFTLDEPGIAFPFSKKLAKENNWSQAFSQQAIEEYKRFIFLCVISSKGASPSHVVDQVWHLHLTYTKSYWEDFCSGTLHKIVHHHPSKGGTEDDHKHVEWYKDTIELYRQTFNEDPPADIWPPPAAHLSAESAVQIEFIENKDHIKKAALFFMLPFAFISIFYQQPVPFLLNGEHFLVFYFLLGITAISIMYSINKNMSLAAAEAADTCYPSKYSIYQAVKFLFGKHRLVQTAIIDLLKKDIIEAGRKYFLNRATESDALRCKNPLIPALLKRKNEQLDYEAMVSMIDEETICNPGFSSLYNFANKRTWWQAFIYFPVLLVAIIRIFQGAANDKPVVFLIISIVIFSFVYCAVFRSTGKKQVVFSTCKRRFEEDSLSTMDLEPHDEILRTFALTGVNAVSGFKEFPLLAVMFAAYPNIAGNWSSDSGSSGSCSSCGGSGCGGGGCGGCGGD